MVRHGSCSQRWDKGVPDSWLPCRGGCKEDASSTQEGSPHRLQTSMYFHHRKRSEESQTLLAFTYWPNIYSAPVIFQSLLCSGCWGRSHAGDGGSPPAQGAHTRGEGRVTVYFWS